MTYTAKQLTSAIQKVYPIMDKSTIEHNLVDGIFEGVNEMAWGRIESELKYELPADKIAAIKTELTK